MKPKFSICVPIWGAKGNGKDYLEYNLNSIYSQTFKDLEVVISDHSIDDELEKYVELWNSHLNISYHRYELGRGSIAPNINNAMRHAKGEYIKILYQDDFFYDENSLQKIADYISEKDIKWLVTGCAHTTDLENIYNPMSPYYHDNIYMGVNTISAPTVLTIKNDEDTLYLNESLKFLDDVEYYKRCYDKFGLPDVIPDVCIINREGGVRATTMLDVNTKNKELALMLEIYGRNK
jgi:glycosyltransferase involved in cell wall biosynthesis